MENVVVDVSSKTNTQPASRAYSSHHIAPTNNAPPENATADPNLSYSLMLESVMVVVRVLVLSYT